MDEMEFLHSLNEEQAAFYAKTLDELCKLIPKKEAESWEDAGKSEELKRARRLIQAEEPAVHAIFAVGELAAKIRQAETVLEMAKDTANTRGGEGASPFGFMPEKVKAGIDAMWVAYRDLRFCVSRMRMLLGEAETGLAEWEDAAARVNGHGR